MVECNPQLDLLFAALADSTRRHILARVAEAELTIGEIARDYGLTFAAISKHIKVLQKAGLVSKRRRGKEQLVIIVPDNLQVAQEHIARYAALWEQRFDQLETLLKSTEE
ncbi:MAG: metalloregulator ArsR/SmtB family transcription factor [Gammaproteobacteria bacterium]